MTYNPNKTFADGEIVYAAQMNNLNVGIQSAWDEINALKAIANTPPSVDLSNYYTKSETDNKIAELQERIAALEAGSIS